MKAKKEWKVGLFLAIALVVAAALIINFSKGTNPFTKTTLLHLTTKNVDGLKRNSVVLMAGVPVGSISAIRLDTKNGEVTLDAKGTRRCVKCGKVHRAQPVTCERCRAGLVHG